MSLLNSISMGFGPMSMGEYRSVAPRGSIASLPQELCVSEDCDDDDVVALERWRDTGTGFFLRTAGSHSRLQVAMAWRESVIVHLD